MEFDWRPGIGDPTVGGWVTVALYVLATLSCLRTAVAIQRSRAPQGDTYAFWRNVTVLFGFLGLNKQLDLQSALTEIGRLVTRHYGWYEQKAPIQLAFIFIVGCALLAAIVWMIVRFRHVPASTALTFFGVSFVLAFVFVRAASFHHFDRFIGTELLGFRWNWLLEMGGISLVIAGSWARHATLVRARAPVRPFGPQPSAERRAADG